jgi:hypothetical protein
VYGVLLLVMPEIGLIGWLPVIGVECVALCTGSMVVVVEVVLRLFC